MRIRFEDEDLERLAYDATYQTKRWAADVTTAYRRVIQRLDAAVDDRDLYAQKSLHFEQLQGDRVGTSSLRINLKYRLIVRLITEDMGRMAIVIDARNHYR